MNNVTSSLMAFLPQYLLSLYLLMIPLYTSINGNSIKSLNPNCPSFSCGNGLVFRYPFWQQGKHLQHCGTRPGLGISCTDHTPLLNLSNHLYLVKNLDYSQNTLTLAYSETNSSNNICPVPLHSVTFNTSTSNFLNYSIDDKMVHFFHNCTFYPPSIEHIKCLQYGAKHTYVFSEAAIPEFDWRRHCESMVNIPVIGKALENVSDLAVGFGGVLQEGFKLKWQPADGACQLCEASGGFCGYNNYTYAQKFACYCSDGRHLANCHDKGDHFFSIFPRSIKIQRSNFEFKKLISFVIT